MNRGCWGNVTILGSKSRGSRPKEWRAAPHQTPDIHPNSPAATLMAPYECHIECIMASKVTADQGGVFYFIIFLILARYGAHARVSWDGGRRLTKCESQRCNSLQLHPPCICADFTRRNHHGSTQHSSVPERGDAHPKCDRPSPGRHHPRASHLSTFEAPQWPHAEGCLLALDMRSSDSHRFLVVHFHLWCFNPWVWVGEKRRQLFHGDLAVHSLLWVIQALHLRFLVFVLPFMYPIEPHY